MSRSILAIGPLLALLSCSLSRPMAAADTTESSASDPQRRTAGREISAEEVRAYIGTVVALGQVPSPFGRFTATRLEASSEGASVVFVQEDGTELPLSFAAPRLCIDCTRGRSFAISWPPDRPEGGPLARAIVDRAVSLDVESARAQLSSTAIERMIGALVTVLIHIDAIGVRLREALWQVVSSVVPASAMSAESWQRMWDNLETRGPGIRDAASSLIMMLLWIVLALLLARETFRVMRLFDGRMRLAIMGLVAGSILLRSLLAGKGPGELHINLLVEDYGLAPAGLLGLLGAFAPTSPETVVAVAIILGSLATGYGSLLSYARRREPATAVAAGVLLSIQPVLIRFSGDCERQSYVLFLAVVALWGLAEYFASRRWTALAVHVVATLLCLNARPEAVFLLTFAGLLIWPGHRLSKVSLGAVGAFAVTVVAAPLVSSRLRDHFAHVGGAVIPGDAQPGPGTTIWMTPEYTSVVVMGLFVIGVAATLAKRERDGLWTLLCLAITTVILRGSVADGWLANARYQTLSLIPFTLSAAIGVTYIGRITATHWNEKGARLATAAAWCAIGASTLPPLNRVTLPRTIDFEFRLLAHVLPTLPADAIIYCARDDESDLDMKKFQLVSNFLGLGSQRWRVWEGEPLPADRTSYFFVQPYCHVRPDEWQMRRTQTISARPAGDAAGAFNACQEAARCSHGNAVTEAIVPARRFAMEEFTASEVVIAMVELSPNACGRGPAPNQPL